MSVDTSFYIKVICWVTFLCPLTVALEFTLTLSQIISHIDGDIDEKGYIDEDFWYNTLNGAISYSWTENGFVIQKLDLKKEKVIFRKENHDITTFKIPPAFLKKKIPKNAQDEIEAFLKYVASKYKL